MKRNPFTIEQVRTFWDQIASEYDRINGQFGWSHTQRFTTMQQFLPEENVQRIVNVWSRTGNATTYIREKYPDAQIENMEASPRMLAIAQEKYPHENFALTDLHDFPQEDESVDVIVSLETLEHVPDPLHFLLECHRILKVGGRIIISHPPAWAEKPLQLAEKVIENHGEGPHRFPSVREVHRTLRRCGFRVHHHRGTVLLPLGPEWLKQAVETLHLRLLRFIGCNRLGIRQFTIADKTEERDPVWNKIHEEIIRPGISMHSGTCIGLSEGTLELADPDGACVPQWTGKGHVPQICYDASPEVDPNYPQMNEQVFGHAAKSALLGEYKRIGIAHANDTEVRSKAASGGILTGLLLHLLDTGKIKGAIVLRMDPEHPWRAIPTIARTREDIIAAAQSKYTLSPVNTILSETEHAEGPLAYIGLPHQVFAIRRLQHLKHLSTQHIDYIFGPFFGNELYGSSVQSFLRKFGAKKDDVISYAHRASEWPGATQAVLKDGRTVSMPKFHANYLIPFHITRSSLISHDLTNEFTDISGGDAWAPVYEDRGKGFSMVITRSEKGDQLLREMEDAGIVSFDEITEEEAIAMQSHGLDLKKRGSQLRIAMCEKLGKRMPHYGLKPLPISLQRKCFEAILSTLFALCSTRSARWIADHTPDCIIGPAFQMFRKRWKKATHGIKRQSLN